MMYIYILLSKTIFLIADRIRKKMCYNINYLTKKKEEYARRLRGLLTTSDFGESWERIRNKVDPVYYETGFNHPDIPVITDDQPVQIQLFGWGLIPFWVKDPKQAVELSNRTLNARGEEIFQKPSFRNSAMKKRCLIIVDGFFEYHWHNGISYPFYIRMKNDDPILLAGLWETWHYKAGGMTRNTCSIVTTRANPLMEYIHNQPKGSEGSRMPLIVPEGMEGKWLMEINDKLDQREIQKLIQPFDESMLDFYTVPRLKGKEGVGNSPQAIIRHPYPELPRK
ncbi:MAG: SOS response-associated peptidase [Cyclobacteriaceae bacterium]|nr:SOS response-associated peptidase [Cyclobacteriaceae bacterium]